MGETHRFWSQVANILGKRTSKIDKSVKWEKQKGFGLKSAYDVRESFVEKAEPKLKLAVQEDEV